MQGQLRMSLQSNISSKAKTRFKMDLFERLAADELSEGRMSVEEPQVEVQTSTSCRCPKSKCLLMYCECFSKGVECGPRCSCYQCRNNMDFAEKRQAARRVVLQRDPNAFSNKLEIIGGEQSQMGYKRGCHCKKTNCFKKYCQCYFAGVKCTYLCNCEQCLNGGQHAYKA